MMKNSLRFFREKNIRKLILGLLILLNLLVVIVGYILLRVMPGGESISTLDMWWESAKILFDPASVLAIRMSAFARVAMGLLVLIGMITFTGGVIGYVTNLITDSIADNKEGKGHVCLEDFTLMLNWNDCAMNIILDHIRDVERNMKRDYIVIFSGEDRIKLEEEIERKIRDFREKRR